MMEKKGKVLVGLVIFMALIFSYGFGEELPKDLKGKIVFVSERAGGYALWVVNASGSDQKRITEAYSGRTYGFAPNALIPTSPQWFPDGKKIVFHQDKIVDELSFRCNDFIWMINIDGSNLRLLTKGSRPQISPDGLRIAFENEDKLWLINSNGTKLSPLNIILSDESYYCWLPDGKRIAVQNGYKKEEPYKEGELWIINLDGIILEKTYFMGNCPRWSPDGKKIAFFRAGTYQIWIMDVDGKNVRELKDKEGKNIGASDFCWSPDSKWIAFPSPTELGDLRGLYGRTNNIFAKEVDGERIYNISKSPGSDSSPSWAE